MPHREIIIVFIAVLLVVSILRSLKCSCTAIMDHPIFAVFKSFRLTTLIGSCLFHDPSTLAFSSRGPIPAHRAAPSLVRLNLILFGQL